MQDSAKNVVISQPTFSPLVNVAKLLLTLPTLMPIRVGVFADPTKQERVQKCTVIRWHNSQHSDS